MTGSDTSAHLEAIRQILAEEKARREIPDVWLQYPNSELEELFPANTSKTIIRKRIGKYLKTVNICVPTDAKIIMYSDGIQIAYFHDVSGCFEFPNGIYVGDLEIVIANLATADQRINYNLIFTA